MKANVFRNSSFQVNMAKNATGKRRLTSSNRHVSTSREELRTQQTFFAINLARRLTENNKALLFFSGKETIQTFNGSN